MHAGLQRTCLVFFCPFPPSPPPPPLFCYRVNELALLWLVAKNAVNSIFSAIVLLVQYYYFSRCHTMVPHSTTIIEV